MANQSHASHTRWEPGYHFVLGTLLFAGLIGSGVNLYKSVGDPQRLYSASLIFVLFLSLTLTAYYARAFALRAQDRVIRSEEHLRHYFLTNRPLDSRLTVDQLIGLRFASDDEFAALAEEAAQAGLSRAEIKKRITAWRADHHRV